MALFYLPLLFVTCADGACSDCAFATGFLLIVPLLMVPLFAVPELIQPFSRVIATLGARPTSQLRYTLAMRFYQAHLTIWRSAWQNSSAAVATATNAV